MYYFSYRKNAIWKKKKRGGFIAFLVSPSNKLKTAKAPHRIRESRKKRERERERERESARKYYNILYRLIYRKER